MSELFRELLLKPLFNFLVIIYNALPAADLGVAVIAMVVLVRIILWPLFASAARSQLTLSKLQPEVERIQKKHKNDKVVQTQEMLALYRRERFNPFSGVFVILIQIPIIIALYQVFLRGVNGIDFSLLYPWVTNPGSLDPVFLGLVNLTKPFLIFTAAAGLFQFLQTYQIMRKVKAPPSGSFQGAMNKQMLWFGPILTVLVLKGLPSVIALYWSTTSIVSLLQQYIIEKKLGAAPAPKP